MNAREAFDAMVGIMAHDTGCADSGIKDESLREKIRVWYDSEMEKIENKCKIVPMSIEPLIAKEYMSPSALRLGYGAEDVAEFVGWLSDGGLG